MTINNEVLTIIISVLTIVGLLGAGIAWAFKRIAVPWLRENLFTPVGETNKQVSQNNFISEEPTLKDSVHLMADSVDKIQTSVNTVSTSMGMLSSMWEHHLRWSSEEVERIWQAISEIKREKNHG